jgi:hypothetical protein
MSGLKPSIDVSQVKSAKSVNTISTRNQLNKTDEYLKYSLSFHRKRSAAMLWFGALFGFLGFGFAFLIGFWKFVSPQLSEFHQQFPSGWGYFPATVSEMVHDPNDPAGMCFFAFEFIGALLIFSSWYTFELQNVYVGNSDLVPLIRLVPCTQISWSMFRQFVPSLGMMLVATVTSAPFAQASALDRVCISIHLTAAVMLFAGYAVCEAWNIGFCNKGSSIPTLKKAEVIVRKLFLAGIIWFYLGFCILNVALLMPLDKYGLGKMDRWEPQTITHQDGSVFKEVVLVDTASGGVLFLKIVCYLCEVGCGLSLVGSLASIFHFCNERKIVLNEGVFLQVDETGEASIV